MTIADKELLAVYRPDTPNPDHELGKPKRRTQHLRLKNLLTKCGWTVLDARPGYHEAYATATAQHGMKFDFAVEDDRLGDDNYPITGWRLNSNGKRTEIYRFSSVARLKEVAQIW